MSADAQCCTSNLILGCDGEGREVKLPALPALRAFVEGHRQRRAILVCN
jgi:hypothetical protein